MIYSLAFTNFILQASDPKGRARSTSPGSVALVPPRSGAALEECVPQKGCAAEAAWKGGTKVVVCIIHGQLSILQSVKCYFCPKSVNLEQRHRDE